MLDEVDTILHPLKSELNWPLGEKEALDLTMSRRVLAPGGCTAFRSHSNSNLLIPPGPAQVAARLAVADSDRADGRNRALLAVGETVIYSEVIRAMFLEDSPCVVGCPHQNSTVLLTAPSTYTRSCCLAVGESSVILMTPLVYPY